MVKIDHSHGFIPLYLAMIKVIRAISKIPISTITVKSTDIKSLLSRELMIHDYIIIDALFFSLFCTGFVDIFDKKGHPEG